MNEEIVRSYILGTVTPERGRSVYKILCYWRNVSIMMAVFFLIWAFIVGVAANEANIVTMIIFVLLVVSIPINIIFARKAQKNVVANWEISHEENKSLPKSFGKVGGAFSGASLGLLGMTGANLFLADISQTALITIVLVIAIFFTILLTRICAVYSYDIQLVKTYCPDLV